VQHQSGFLSVVINDPHRISCQLAIKWPTESQKKRRPTCQPISEFPSKVRWCIQHKYALNLRKKAKTKRKKDAQEMFFGSLGPRSALMQYSPLYRLFYFPSHFFRLKTWQRSRDRRGSLYFRNDHTHRLAMDMGQGSVSGIFALGQRFMRARNRWMDGVIHSLEDPAPKLSTRLSSGP